MSLSRVVVQSLQDRSVQRAVSGLLLDPTKSRVRPEVEEGLYWDFKSKALLDLSNPHNLCKLAKTAAAFHNARGGFVFIGIEDSGVVDGVTASSIPDAYVIRTKLHKYLGDSVEFFTGKISTCHRGKYVLALGVPCRTSNPLPIRGNGPHDPKGRPIIARNEYYLRVGDQCRLVRDPIDLERLFGGRRTQDTTAYDREIDDPFFILMAPHHSKFVGRVDQLMLAKKHLRGRFPIILFDGHGGVGKSALAIELCRDQYRAQCCAPSMGRPSMEPYDFIICLSAKNRIMTGAGVRSRRPEFSSLSELLEILARCLQIDVNKRDSVDDIRDELLEWFDQCRGILLLDNMESIEDVAVFDFVRDIGMLENSRVKVLLTSRLGIGVGAATISVPELSDAESKELLYFELERAGYDGEDLLDGEGFTELVHATSGVPLAIKWAAGTAVGRYGASSHSKTTVHNVLRGVAKSLSDAGTVGKEFLQFCFFTMYSDMTKHEKNISKVMYYLGDSWSVQNCALCLGVDVEKVILCLRELERRKMITMENVGGAVQPKMLALTRSFLKDEWNRDQSLQKEVLRRLADVMPNAGAEAFLHMDQEQRYRTVIGRGIQLRKGGDKSDAIRMARLCADGTKDPETRYTAGELLHDCGERDEGLALIRTAMFEARLDAETGKLVSGSLVGKWAGRAIRFASMLENRGNVDELREAELIRREVQGVSG